MPKEEKLFYIIDDAYDAPKWAKHLKMPQDNMTLYLYGTEKWFIHSYMPLTADVGFIEEQLEFIYKRDVDEATGYKKVKVDRWRS